MFAVLHVEQIPIQLVRKKAVISGLSNVVRRLGGDFVVMAGLSSVAGRLGRLVNLHVVVSSGLSSVVGRF